MKKGYLAWSPSIPHKPMGMDGCVDAFVLFSKRKTHTQQNILVKYVLPLGRKPTTYRLTCF